MKSYLVSWLRKTHAGATLDTFERERKGEWIVWEAGPWRPPSSQKRETLVSGPETRLLTSGESLAIQLLAKDGSAEVKLGRDAINDLVIDDATLSRVHIVFQRTVGGWTIRDAGSRNGTRLDGQPVGAGAVPLLPGASIEAGAVRLSFHDAASLFVRLRAGE